MAPLCDVVVTGLNKWIAVFSVGIVCTFYTTIVSFSSDLDTIGTDVARIPRAKRADPGGLVQGEGRGPPEERSGKGS